MPYKLINNHIYIHTNNVICGAIIEPKRPIIEVIPMRDMRNSVGNISAVNTYMALNAIEMANLLPKNDTNFIMKNSENKILYYLEFIQDYK